MLGLRLSIEQVFLNRRDQRLYSSLAGFWWLLFYVYYFDEIVDIKFGGSSFIVAKWRDFIS